MAVIDWWGLDTLLQTDQRSFIRVLLPWSISHCREQAPEYFGANSTCTPSDDCFALQV